MLNLLLNHFLFCISGVLMVVLVQWIDINGITDVYLGIPAFAIYFGYFLAYPSLFLQESQFNKFFFLLVSTDIIANLLMQISIYLAGGQLFTIAYASIILWSAILKKLILKNKLNRFAWASLIIIIIGLIISSINGKTYGSFVELGILCGIFGALSNAINYVCSEYLMTNYNVNPFYITAFNGLIGMSILVFFGAFYTIPRWDVSVNNYYTIVVIFFTISTSTLIHAITFYNISKTPENKNNPRKLFSMNDNFFTNLENEGNNLKIFYGAIVIGINKALQTCLTFIVNHIIFCDTYPIECITVPKIISLICVVIGIVLYSVSNKINFCKKKNNEITESYI